MRKHFIAKGTTCTSCEKIIKRQALKVQGVKSADFDYSKEEGWVEFDESKTDIDTILSSIEEKGYECLILERGSGKGNISGWIFGVIGVAIIGYFLFGLVDKINMPQISSSMGYGLLFAVGLLTGFHCIAMCGGFVVGYSTKCSQEGKKPHKAHLAYGIGKTLSYTIIGALFGLLGSFIAFTPTLRGAIGIFAGVFLLLYGLKMLNIIPALRRINIPTPKFLMKFTMKKQTEHSHPFAIGLLNGLMIACGPLQALYVMAAGTGSMVEGAKVLFIFGLGTLPVMIAFGYFVSMVSNKLTHKILKASGAIVILLGLVMINNGLVLTGTGYDLKSIAQSQSPLASAGTGTPTSGSQAITGSQAADSKNIAVQKEGYQEIHMDVTASGWSPDTFVLKKGVPVKWIINGKELTSCNNAIQVPKYNLKFNIKPGEQTIDFTPTESGTVRWSCWMGMISGTFIVKDDISDTAGIQKEVANQPKSSGGSCGMGGGCGCGMMARK